MAKPEKGMGRIQLLMGSPDGPSLMVGKILSSRRGRNGLKVMIVLDIFSLLCLAAQKYEELSKCKIQVVFTGTVELRILLLHFLRFQLMKSLGVLIFIIFL
jgi:hypothetical protein